ncbi:MAG: peptidoglycan-binding protein [Aulosira sp. DedQUE10]|nr:peptidoglycan-binding protein [Aulosira sp. DedQUE10]
MEINSDLFTSLPKANWIKQGGLGGWEFLSGIPEEKDFLSNLDLEDKNKIVEIVKERLRFLATQKSSVSVGSDERDILPMSSLQVGMKRSLAVCRIARFFPLNDFKVFIEDIKQEIEKRKDDTNFNQPGKIKEIFSIPDNIFNEIFLTDEIPKDEPLKGRFYLGKLTNISENQLSVLNPIPIGTGFLVGVTHLITNNHVISNRKIASQCVAQFNYTEDTLGYTQQTIDYELDPEILFVNEPSLDYTLIQLKSSIYTRQAGYYFDWIQLIENDLNIFPGLTTEIRNNLNEEDLKLLTKLDRETNSGDNIFIVHHPKGKQKKIDISNNKVIDNGLYKNFLRYKVDSDYGSSGGLVVNTKWEAVALHHAAVPKDYSEDEQEHKVEIVAQQGIRICRIVEDLKKKSFHYRKLRNFIEDFVITSEQLNNPPLAFAIELDGFNDYVLLKNFVDCQFITQPQSSNGFSIEALICPYSNEVESTIFSKFYQNFCNDCIATLGYDALRVYINKEGKIVFSRKMYTLPTLPLEIPQEETNQPEFIFNLQSILKILSYSVVVNGVYDDHTKKALQEFVKNLQDNIEFDPTRDISDINPQILNYLNSQITFLGLYDLNYDALEQLSYENKDLKIPVSENPSKGEIVKGLQKLLNSLGYYNYQPNGVYDKETCNSVKKFQKAFGLRQDGVCGPLTQKMITLIQSYEFATEEVVNFGEFNKITISCRKGNEELKIDIQINGNPSNLQLCQKSTNENLQKIQEKIRNCEKNIDINQGSPVIIGAYSNKNLAISDFPLKGNLWSFFRGAIAKVCLKDEKNVLISYWQFEEGKGDSSNNLIPTNKNLVLEIYGEPKWLRQSNFPAPLLPSALKFDDKNNYVDCGNDENLNVNEVITIEAWFKHKFGNCLIVSRVDSQKNGYSLSWYNGKIRVVLQHPGSSEKPVENTVVYTKDNAPQDQVWHHVAFTWDKKSQEISIYIDGRIQDCVVEGQCKTIIFAGQAKSIGLFTGPLPQLTESLRIGYKEEKEIYYSVAIADVRLWKVARTQDDIKANMSRRLLADKEEYLAGYWRLDNDKDVRNLVNNKPGKIIGEPTCFPSPSITLPKEQKTQI